MNPNLRFKSLKVREFLVLFMFNFLVSIIKQTNIAAIIYIVLFHTHTLFKSQLCDALSIILFIAILNIAHRSTYVYCYAIGYTQVRSDPISTLLQQLTYLLRTFSWYSLLLTISYFQNPLTPCMFEVQLVIYNFVNTLVFCCVLKHILVRTIA